MADALPQPTWKAFAVFLIFPLHIVLGVLSVPVALYLLLVVRSYIAWAIALVYAPFYLYPAQRKYPGWKGFESLWRWFDYANTGPSYLGGFAVHNTENVDPKAQYFVAIHPHGTITLSRSFWRSALLEKLFPNWRMLAASVLYAIPLIRECTNWFGAVDAARKNCEMWLKKGTTLVVYPGGLDEANVTELTKEVRLRTRTGFIRLAVQHHVDVLPMFVFGELDLVKAVNPLPKFAQKFCRKVLRMSTNIFVGRFGILPKRVPLNLCIGKPIPVRVAAEGLAFDSEVERVHALYKAELRRLYQENAAKFGYEDRELVFLCEKKGK